MCVLKEYIIPFSSLGIGIQEYRFILDDKFFEAVPKTEIIENGQFEVHVVLDKKTKSTIIHIVLNGFSVTNCDRCLTAINLPINGSYMYTLKYGTPEGDDAEIIYIDENQEQLDLSSILYESICLSTPISKTYDCEADPNPPCNIEMLEYLEDHEPSKNENNPIWDVLKDIK